MKTLIVSDIHGNLPALELILNSNKDVDLIISLGDVVNYGPWSNECVELLDSMNNVIKIKGNHEVYFLNGQYNQDNHIANTFFNFCYPLFTKRNIINNYLEYFFIKETKFTHTIDDRYIFPDSEILLTSDVFIGHSHKQFLKYSNKYLLVNVGSVGQNRTNIDIIDYTLWDSESKEIKLCKKKFDSNILINEMISRKYPQICIDYIQTKKIELG